MTGAIVRIDRVADMPWKNGGGTTRELALHRMSDGAFAWRISVATIARSGPFSLYPAIDRTLVVMSGRGTLRIGDRIVGLRRLETLRFDGETRVLAIVESGPVRVLNILSARHAWDHQVDVARQGACVSGGRSGPYRFFVPLVGPSVDPPLIAGDLVPLDRHPVPAVRPAAVIAFRRLPPGISER